MIVVGIQGYTCMSLLVHGHFHHTLTFHWALRSKVLTKNQEMSSCEPISGVNLGCLKMRHAFFSYSIAITTTKGRLILRHTNIGMSQLILRLKSKQISITTILGIMHHPFISSAPHRSNPQLAASPLRESAHGAHSSRGATRDTLII